MVMADIQFIHLLERLGSLLRSEQRRVGAVHGLQPVHLQVLDYLARCNRYSDTPAALARFLGATKGTTSQSLLVLQNKGLIKKTADRNDRRVVHLQLSAKGRRLTNELFPPAGWVEAIEALSDSTIVIEAKLAELLRNLQAQNNQHTFGQCHTCRHLQVENTNQFRCGLTGDPLSEAETLKICHEHRLHNTVS